MPKTLFKFSSSQRSNIRLVIAVALSVFLCEAFVMIAIIPLYHLSPWLVALFDASILVLILSPVLYLFVFRPMAQHINERERRRIATELHDRIGQTLAVTKIKLGELREALPADTTGDALTEIREFIEQTIQDTRSLTFELSPPVLYELGLEAALAWLANQAGGKHGLRIELKDDGRPKPLDNGCRVIAFQAARELLFNIVKHAQAKSATISIRKDDDAIRIDIEDDGIGFDTSEPDTVASGPKGFGLFSIRERLRPLGGRMAIHSEPGRGTRVTIVLPLACNIEVTEE